MDLTESFPDQTFESGDHSMRDEEGERNAEHVMIKKIKSGNIYSKIPDPKDNEIFETLIENKKFKIERIISRGQATAGGEWLKEAQDEWVIVLKGEGRLKFKGKTQPVTLKSGDYVFIPANTSHRVEWTSPRTKTVWLAIAEKRH